MPAVRRPTVLHCMRDWGLPSERFVPELVGSSRATRAIVVCGRRAGVTGGRLRTYEVGALASRVAEQRQRRLRRGSIAVIAVAERARILHAHLGYWAAEAAVVARRLNRPLVVSLHGHDLLVEGPAMEEPHALLEADVVIVPSAYLANAAVNFGIREDRLRIIPSGVDLSRLRFAERRPSAGPVVVTFAGRFVEKKGVLDAARALALVQEQRPDVEARFVGYGPLEGQLRRLLADLGLRAQIWDGASPDAVVTAFADTHLVLTPSRTAPDGDAESLGLVNLEALASGIPVVTTQHGGIPEAVCSQAAALVPERDVIALAAAISDLLATPDRWPAMGRAGRAHVSQNFDPAARAAEVEDLYLALLQSFKRADRPRLRLTG
ncbi:MAG TPA: glycosyltransferase [Acidimicrobiales bacterium]